jgi:hypothetical protein
MTARIIDGKQAAKEIRAEVGLAVEERIRRGKPAWPGNRFGWRGSCFA